MNFQNRFEMNFDFQNRFEMNFDVQNVFEMNFDVQNVFEMNFDAQNRFEMNFDAQNRFKVIFAIKNPVRAFRAGNFDFNGSFPDIFAAEEIIFVVPVFGHTFRENNGRFTVFTHEFCNGTKIFIVKAAESASSHDN